MDKNSNTEARLSAEFDKSINKLGRYTSIIALAFMLSIPLITQIYYGLDISISDVLVASSGLIAMFLPMAVVENISYYQVIGAGGIYLSSITGNVLNMKLPCAIAGMKIANVEPGSKEGDVISIISIGVSSIVTTIILFLGMFFVGQALVPLLNSPLLAPGFANVTPAILGATAVPSLLGNKRLSVVPVILSLAAYFIIGANFGMYQSYVLIVVMVLSVGSAYLNYKKSK
ncbi:MAG: hypothetical protein GX053_02485 [Tissierella sp.]|nr:hypothetical protein [Tissierella sp.]